MADPSGATPLSAEELRRVHFPVELSKSTRDPKPVWCAHCGSFDRPWPCTVARLLATLDAALASRDDAGLREAALVYIKALDAERGRMEATHADSDPMLWVRARRDAEQALRAALTKEENR